VSGWTRERQAVVDLPHSILLLRSGQFERSKLKCLLEEDRWNCFWYDAEALTDASLHESIQRDLDLAPWYGPDAPGAMFDALCWVHEDTKHESVCLVLDFGNAAARESVMWAVGLCDYTVWHLREIEIARQKTGVPPGPTLRFGIVVLAGAFDSIPVRLGTDGVVSGLKIQAIPADIEQYSSRRIDDSRSSE
jgi:hypothetical protein